MSTLDNRVLINTPLVRAQIFYKSKILKSKHKNWGNTIPLIQRHLNLKKNLGLE
jgi:hypothetical protein